MTAFEALGFATGAILLLQNILQCRCSPLVLSRRAAAPLHLPANFTSILTNGTVNEHSPHGVELEISPFPIHVSYIDPDTFDDFTEAAVRKIKDDMQTHGKETPVAERRWELATSGVGVLFVKDAHYTDDLTYGMIDGALTELFYSFALFDYRESNLKVFEDFGERRLIARGYVAKTVRGSQGSSLVIPGDASTNNVDVTR